MAAHKPDSARDLLFKIALGSVSCMLPLPLLNPLEVIKVRLQLQGELAQERGQGLTSRVYGAERHYRGLLRGAWAIAKEERLAGLYKGVGAAALREAIYAGFRMGTYDSFKALLLRPADRGDLPLWKKLVAGATVGSAGAFLACPTDVVKVRLQADPATARELRRYPGTLSAFATIFREEGIRGLWKGAVPTVGRAAIVSAAMMPSYDHTKHLLLRRGWLPRDGPAAHVCAAMVAGLLMALVSSPWDVVKTRVVAAAHTASPYAGPLDCLRKTLAAEGVLGLYKGLVPTYLRLGPHTLLAFLAVEKLRQLAGFKPI